MYKIIPNIYVKLKLLLCDRVTIDGVIGFIEHLEIVTTSNYRITGFFGLFHRPVF
jgi:hypothetical protein